MCVGRRAARYMAVFHLPFIKCYHECTSVYNPKKNLISLFACLHLALFSPTSLLLLLCHPLCSLPSLTFLFPPFSHLSVPSLLPPFSSLPSLTFLFSSPPPPFFPFLSCLLSANLSVSSFPSLLPPLSSLSSANLSVPSPLSSQRCDFKQISNDNCEI